MYIQKTWPTTQLLGITVDCCSQSVLMQALEDYCQQPDVEPLHMITTNAEQIYSGTQDKDILALLQHADIVTPDGIGVVWGLERQGVPVKRMPGVEFTENLFKRGVLKLFVLGSSQENLDILQDTMGHKYPQARLVGMHHGYFSEEETPDIIAEIKRLQPHVVLVALGMPKQELWISRYRSELRVPLMIGIGGSLDVISGQLKRAPLWMREAHLEWFYRLIQQPQRWRRMLALPKFVLQVIRS